MCASSVAGSRQWLGNGARREPSGQPHIRIPNHARVAVVPVVQAAHIGLDHADAVLGGRRALHKAAHARIPQPHRADLMSNTRRHQQWPPWYPRGRHTCRPARGGTRCPLPPAACPPGWRATLRACAAARGPAPPRPRGTWPPAGGHGPAACLRGERDDQGPLLGKAQVTLAGAACCTAPGWHRRCTHACMQAERAASAGSPASKAMRGSTSVLTRPVTVSRNMLPTLTSALSTWAARQRARVGATKRCSAIRQARPLMASLVTPLAPGSSFCRLPLPGCTCRRSAPARWQTAQQPGEHGAADAQGKSTFGPKG